MCEIKFLEVNEVGERFLDFKKGVIFYFFIVFKNIIGWRNSIL